MSTTKQKIIVILSILSILPTSVFATNRVSLSPTTSTIGSNQSFTVDVLIDSVTDLFTVGFDLIFNSNLMQFTSTSDGGLLTKGGAPTLLLANENPAGDLVFSFARFGSDLLGVSTTSTSTIAHLNFQSKTIIGTTSVNFDTVFQPTLCIRSSTSTGCVYATYNPANWLGGSVDVIDNIAPSIPSGLTVIAVSSSRIDLSWASSTDNIVVIGYKIYRDNSQIATTTLTSYQNTGLNQATTYTYAVAAYDAAGNTSATSTSASATTLDVSTPTVPTNLVATVASSTQVNLSWTGSTDNVAVAGYKIYRGNNQIATSTLTNYQDKNLTASTSYFYNVAAYDAAGNTSVKSATSTATTMADTLAPTVPVNFTASAVSSSQIDLTWSPSADDVGVAGYRIYRDSTSTAAASINDIKYSDTGLSPSTAYNYFVLAYDAAGNTSLFATTSATTQAAPAPVISGGGGGGYYVTPAAIATSSPALNQTMTSTTISTASQNDSADKVFVLGAGLAVNLTSLADVKSEIVEAVSQGEAQTVYGYNQYVRLDETGKNLYTKITDKNLTGLKERDKYSIAYFIQFGAPTTKRLGAGERAGVINSFKAAFARLPQAETDWQDVIKIASGRWTKQRSVSAEERAKTSFRKIYLRQPNQARAYDNNAVMILAYGLRPANRNLNSEAAAIKIFRGIYKYSPTSAIDWDIMRTIAYSGASR